MPSMYELIGHGQWVDAQQAVGRTVPDVVKAAPKAAPSHLYGDCAKGVSQCKRHRRVYRAMLAKKRAQETVLSQAAERDESMQRFLQAQRAFRKIAAAGAKNEPASPPPPSVNAFCERGEHTKCDLEGSGIVHTAQGPRPCACSHHQSESSPALKRDTRVRLTWPTRTQCTDEELVEAIVAPLREG